MRTHPSILATGLMILHCSCVFDSAGLSRPARDAGPGPDAGADPDAGANPDAHADPDAGCTDECAPGTAPRCSADRRAVETCGAGNQGCTAWVAETACALEDHCVDATSDAPVRCAPCTTCTEGEATCVENATSLRSVCVASGGCTLWQEQDCGPGALCEVPGAGQPALCESCVECTAADPACATSGLAIDRCELAPDTGCRAWAAFACPTDFVCAPGSTGEVCSLEGSAGITDAGSAGYPTTTLGNTATGSGPVLGSYLVADKYTTPTPLTALQFKTYGTDGGSVRISVYDHDVANDLPGNRLFPEVVANLTQNAWTTIDLPARAHLPAGTYWIVFNASADDGITYSTQTGGARVWRAMGYGNTLPASGGSGWTRSTSMDCTHLVGVAVRGYAKATRVTLSEATAEANALRLYAHGAGNVRLAIYDDSAGPGTRLWESGSTAAAAGAWISVPVGAGTPASLTLGAGTYWLVWQWDALGPGPGFAAGSSGEGHFIALPYGPFPAAWPGGTPSSETWSLHLSYTALAPPIGW